MSAMLPALGELIVDEMSAPAALEKLAGEWRELWDRCPGARCFQRPEWILPWTRHFFRGEKVWTLALRRNGRLAGLAPLFIHRHHRNPSVRQVSFLGAGITDYLDMLIEPGIADWGAALILRHLAEHPGRWDICDLQELPAHSPVLRAAIPDALQTAWLPCGICPVLELPATVDEFNESLRGRFKQLRRTIHQLHRMPEVEFEAAGGSNYHEFLEDLFRLHRERWKERRESGMLADPQIRGFHRDVAAGFLKAGFLRAWCIRYDGETISVWYGFAARGRYYAYLTGFDPVYAQFSPGQVLLAHSMCAAIEEGVREYDFLRKTEAFKHRWGARDQANRRLLLWHANSLLPAPNFVEDARADLAAL